jgi:hypothetical protein
MNARIGAASAQGGDLLGSEFFESLFQFILDGETRTLALPALIGLTVVGDAQSDSHCKVSVLTGDLKPPDVLRVWGFTSKFKSIAAILAGMANFALCGAVPATLPLFSEGLKVLKVLLVFRL